MKATKRLVVSLTILLLVAASLYVYAADTPAAPPAAPAASSAATLSPHVLGKADAPVLMNEYVSLTCPHCAEFYTSVLPDLEKQYVDTGKVRIALHEFARDATDLKAFALARCMPDDEYFPFIGVLFGNQQAWIMAPDPDKILIQYAKLGGLSEDRAVACLGDTKTQDAIAAGVKEAQDKFGIQSTPTFLLSPGSEKIEGSQSAAEFAAKFDKLLAAKK